MGRPPHAPRISIRKVSGTPRKWICCGRPKKAPPHSPIKVRVGECDAAAKGVPLDQPTNINGCPATGPRKPRRIRQWRARLANATQPQLREPGRCKKCGTPEGSHNDPKINGVKKTQSEECDGAILTPYCFHFGIIVAPFCPFGEILGRRREKSQKSVDLGVLLDSLWAPFSIKNRYIVQ